MVLPRDPLAIYFSFSAIERRLEYFLMKLRMKHREIQGG